MKKKKIKQYLISCLFVYVLCFVVISTAIAITYFPSLREGFSMFFACTPMTWEKAKPVLLLDYLIAVPVSLIGGVLLELSR